MTISSPHNDRLKEIRKLARRRAREQTGRFVAEGEDLLAAADAAGWPALERYCAAGSGLDGVEVEPELLAGVSQLGIGHARARRSTSSAGRTRPPGRCASRCTASPIPGNVGTILRSALAFGAAVGRARAGLRRPVRAEGGAGVDGRAVRGAARALSRPSRSCRARRSRSTRTPASRSRGRRWRRRRRRRSTLAASAPSGPGCPTTCSPPATGSRGSRSPASRSTPRWRRPSRSTR